ncbi:MAG: serine hydrolase, partial [Chloroflexota bacterium]|nr:serine hydrolase [Chloroflexota bacterium]
MPYTPSDEDEQQEAYRPQRRKRAVTPRKYDIEPRPDEYPETPKVRRASLYKEQQNTEPAAKPKTNVTPERPIQKPKPNSTKRSNHYAQNQVEETEWEHNLIDTQDGTTRRRNLVDTGSDTARRRRLIDTEVGTAQRRNPLDTASGKAGRHHPGHPNYASPPPAHRHHGHSQLSLYDQILHVRYNRPVVIIVSTLLCLLIIIPLIVNVVRSQTTSTAVNPGFGNPTPVPGGAQLVDPRQLIIVPQDSDHPAPPVAATAAYLFDADTGTTLYAHNPFLHLPMLSTTKLMTALLAAEHGTPDQRIVITDQIDHEASQLSADSARFNFKKGEIYTLREMLYALFLVSGNDAAIAIADTLGGNQVNFVAQMNDRAHQLGLNDTHYINPHGLLA